MLQSRSTKPEKSDAETILRPVSRLNAGYALSLGTEDRWRPERNILIHPGLLLSISVKRSKVRVRGELGDYQPGFQNRPTLLNLSGVPFPAFRGLHPHQ